MPLNVLAAQDAPENTSVVTYGEDYFKKYSPLTLIDILERIPGVPAILGQGNGQRQQERGFGSSGDQILINGKRLSAKGNSIRDLLSRTPAGDVERVELIRGAADGLEVQSEGLVVNVIIKEDASTSSTFWKVGAFYMTGHKLLPDFEVSHKGKRDKLDYTFAAEALLRAGKFNRDEIFYDANDIQTGARDVDGDWSHKRIKLTTNLSYDFDDGEIFNINGLYNRFRNENDQHHVDRDVGGETLFWDSGDNFLEWEIAGDYSRNFGFLGNLKSRFVINREANDDNLTNRFNGSGDARYIYNKEIFDFNSSEEILRVSFTKNLSSSQSLEYGGEGAFNSFSQIFSSEERDTAGEPLELTSANNIIVKENRYEIFAHHNYTITPKMVLQSSLTTEFSKISSDTILADDIVTVNNSFTF
ncbi:MAG: TonB-dependent receptor plug domain-containing protein, partial [Kordiimonadaceae bacterium]|nr:TonB-dependent receptor plug domain-containing protein [Kordiimonadaceae bacterium]